jgi:antirestriction protein ArdC
MSEPGAAIMVTTTSIHEAITKRVIEAIEKGQTPPWRKAWRPDVENSGFPTDPATLRPYKGVDVLLLNLAAMEKGLDSKFWATEDEWGSLDATISGQPTILVDGRPVFNANQTLLSLGSAAYRSRKRRTPVAADYGPAEAVITASGATIHHRVGMEAAYYYAEDHIIFPARWQFEHGPGGIVGFCDSLFHEVAGHWTEPRIGFDGPALIREFRAEITAPFLASQLGIPVLCDMPKIRNHGKHLQRWIKAMRADPTLSFNVAEAASQAVAYLLSLKG